MIEVGVAQPLPPAQLRAEEFLRRILQRNRRARCKNSCGGRTRTGRWIFRVVSALRVFPPSLQEVHHSHLDRVQATMRRSATLLRSSHAMLHLAEVDYVIAFGDAHHSAARAEAGVYPPCGALQAQIVGMRGSSRLRDSALLHGFSGLRFVHHRGSVQPRELVLFTAAKCRAPGSNASRKERTVDIEFERTRSSG